MLPLDRERVLEVLPLSVKVIDAWLPGFNNAMDAYAINTPVRVAMFFASIGLESCELTAMEEDLHYTAAGLRKTWPTRFTDDVISARYAAAGPQAIANYVYASRLGNGAELSGDGWLYRARGPNGVTFRANYAKCSKDTTGDENVLLEHPEFLMDPEFGAASAAWYWATHGCNDYADKNDFDGVRDCINIGHKTQAHGDSIGYAKAEDYLRRALLAFR